MSPFRGLSAGTGIDWLGLVNYLLESVQISGRVGSRVKGLKDGSRFPGEFGLGSFQRVKQSFVSRALATHICLYIYIYTHTRAHTHTHIYIYIYILSFLFFGGGGGVP